MPNIAGDSCEVFEFDALIFVNKQTVVKHISHIIAEFGTVDIKREAAFQIKNLWIMVILEIGSGVVPFLIVANDAIETGWVPVEFRSHVDVRKRVKLLVGRRTYRWERHIHRW